MAKGQTAVNGKGAQTLKPPGKWMIIGLSLAALGGAIAAVVALTPGGSWLHDTFQRVDPVTNTGLVVDAGLLQLRNLNWQAALVLLTILLASALAATWILRISWRFRKPTFPARLIKGAAHTYTDHLRLNRRDCAEFLKTKPETASQTLADRLSKEHQGHYVITVVESQSKRVCLYKEMHLQFVHRGRGAVDEERLQLAIDDLTTVRLRNGYPDDDDDLNAEGKANHVSGRYDIYLRPVRWYDVRHWLLHPNREIRIVVWVTMITTVFPMLLGFLFDAA